MREIIVIGDTGWLIKSEIIMLDFSDWLEINHSHNDGWKPDKHGNPNDESEFDELYEEFTYYQQEMRSINKQCGTWEEIEHEIY